MRPEELVELIDRCIDAGGGVLAALHGAGLAIVPIQATDEVLDSLASMTTTLPVGDRSAAAAYLARAVRLSNINPEAS